MIERHKKENTYWKCWKPGSGGQCSKIPAALPPGFYLHFTKVLHRFHGFYKAAGL